VSKRLHIPFIGKQTDGKEGRSNGDEWLKRRRGGVALLVRDGITCWVPEFKIPGSLFKGPCEVAGAQIKCGNRISSVFSWYIPPEVGDVNKEFLSYVGETRRP
jgi:hypothetical protein